MHISTSTITNTVYNTVNSNYQKYSDILTKIASNKNFTKMSENTSDATKVLKINDSIAKLEEYQSNIKTATNSLDYTYNALSDISDELNSISALTSEAANSTTTTESAEALATEIKERVDIIIDKMNSKYLDDYIFSGTNTGMQTYKKDDLGNVIYQGSTKESGARNLTISEGITFQYNITADEIFGDMEETDNFFNQMNELNNLLTATELDYNAIREKLNTISETQESVTHALGQASAKVAKLDSTTNLNDSTLINLTEKKSNLEDLDISKAATELATAQNTLQASYSICSTVLENTSLLNYL